MYCLKADAVEEETVKILRKIANLNFFQCLLYVFGSLGWVGVNDPASDSTEIQWSVEKDLQINQSHKNKIIPIHMHDMI